MGTVEQISDSRVYQWFRLAELRDEVQRMRAEMLAAAQEHTLLIFPERNSRKIPKHAG